MSDVKSKPSAARARKPAAGSGAAPAAVTVAPLSSASANSAGATAVDVGAELAKRVAAIGSAAVNSAARAQLQVELLEYVEEQHLRQSALVAEHGFGVLLYNSTHSSFLGEAVWNLYERVCLAAFDAHNAKVAEECLAVLSHKFGGPNGPNSSSRVKRLYALRAESQGNFDEANALYEQLLKDQPTNAFAMKRRAAMFRARGQWSRAADELNKYLEVFSADANAWEELTEVYIALEKYELAKFCLEELIVLAPEHYLYHTQYAEVMYTLGGRANVDVARHYFAQALELKPDHNARALLGLVLCLRGRASGASAAGAAGDDVPSTAVASGKSAAAVTDALCAGAAAKLMALYNTHSTAEQAAAVEALIKQLQL